MSANVLDRIVVDDPDAPALATAWEGLTRRAPHSPFDLPAWLLPWRRSYGKQWRSFLLTWWRGDRLVAVAPLAVRERRLRGVRVRELELWGRTGTPLHGTVDVVVDPAERDAVCADLGTWLAGPSIDWDVLDVLHMAPASVLLSAVASAHIRWRVSLTRVLHSREYVLDLHADEAGWQGPLGARARHEVGREARMFEHRMGGVFDVVRDPGETDAIVSVLRRHVEQRWGARDAYFRRDPAFGGFLASVVRSLIAAGAGRIFVARDAGGVQGCLVTIVDPPSAVALMIGTTDAPQYAPLSLGKGLFMAAIQEAGNEGCRTFSFLTEDGYKARFWHATGRPIENGLIARGPLGLAIATSVALRRVLPAIVRDALHGRWRDDHLA